jgi:hypothetical protein
MKLHATLTGLAAAILAAVALVPAAAPWTRHLLVLILVLGLWLALKSIFARPPSAGKRTDAPAETRPRAEAPPPAAPLPAAPPPAEAEVLTLLALLQEKGRFIDFLMDDITPYGDAQVGAAARVVHQGCKAVLAEHLTIVPVSLEKEGTRLSVPTDAPADAYRLVGRITGSPPFTGTLLHKGWRAEKVKLPRVLTPEPGTRPTIAPAQVELT